MVRCIRLLDHEVCVRDGWPVVRETDARSTGIWVAAAVARGHGQSSAVGITFFRILAGWRPIFGVSAGKNGVRNRVKASGLLDTASRPGAYRHPG